MYLMAMSYPQFRVITNRGNWARWSGDLRPSALSDTYTIEISYTIRRRPEIRVLTPELRLRPGHERLPHVLEGNKLCVHQAHEWRGDSILAHTIVPWTVAWLYFYEVWFATGSWEGGGTHPDLPQHKSMLCHPE